MNSSWYIENNISPEVSVGIDEVGRGPLAGPVVAAAVWISDEGVAIIESEQINIRDSKKLTTNQRDRIVAWAQNQPKHLLKFAVGEATVEEIDSLNILKATFLAMQRAYNLLNVNNTITLVDGNRAPLFGKSETKTIIKGDDKVLSIALASIIAKQYRDNIMKNLSKQYPVYGWETNVGYGTQEHIQSILIYGATPYHRVTFAPIKDLIKASGQLAETLNVLTTPEPKTDSVRIQSDKNHRLQ